MVSSKKEKSLTSLFFDKSFIVVILFYQDTMQEL